MATRPPARLPVLAMVDAFIGGVAIVLIMIVISEPDDMTPDTIPTADVGLACLDAETFYATIGPELATPMPEPIPISDLVPRLAAFAKPDSLSLRVQFIGTASRAGCLWRGQDRLETANLMTLAVSEDDEAVQPVFLTHVRLVEQDALPPRPEASE
jgi:hypothetical protein